MSIEEVADWVEQIGFPDYKKCFSDNFIDVSTTQSKLNHVQSLCALLSCATTAGSKYTTCPAQLMNWPYFCVCLIIFLRQLEQQGKKLETVNASKLPKLGVTDFEDIKKITNRIQALCESVKPDWGRSVAGKSKKKKTKKKKHVFLTKRDDTLYSGRENKLRGIAGVRAATLESPLYTAWYARELC